MEILYYIEANRMIPDGRVSSTARRGLKWANKVKAGDIVEMRVTGTEELIGFAAITEVETMPYGNVLNQASHNHVAFFLNEKNDYETLKAALEAAYGPMENSEDFTVLHILPLARDAMFMTGIPFDRIGVMIAINSERDYQIAKWGDRPKDLSTFICYMNDYLREATTQASRLPNSAPDAAATVRKVVTLGVAALEQHGARGRTADEMKAAATFRAAYQADAANKAVLSTT